MNVVSIQLRASRDAHAEIAAWYLPQADVSDWLRELTSWDISQASFRLHVLPRSAAVSDSAGVLVSADDGRVAEVKASPSCIPYQVVCDRLFIPCDAQFYPPVTNTELHDLLAQGLTYVWHPGIGLVGFEPRDVRRLGDLISIGEPVDAQWDRAEPGVVFPTRLTSIMPAEPPTLESVLQSGRGDIGSQDVKTLPRGPNEPSGLMAGLGAAFGAAAMAGRKGIAGMVKAATAMVPANSDSRTWVNSVEDWANRQANAADASKREKEVSRLLNMLEENPDMGLQFAIPFGGDAARGAAASGNSLMRRSGYSIGGGSGPADYWEINPYIQIQLQQRYRELANREIGLGRHRRAAYIFAELLGDYSAAAKTLEDGRLFRDAAIIYRQRLNSIVDAARCLERGGLITEAIEIYIELESHEKVGDLQRQLHQEEAAVESYERAVQSYRDKLDHVRTARLLETKLDSVDRAIDELAGAWPDSPQAQECYTAGLRLLGRTGRHDTSARWIDERKASGLTQPLQLALVDLLASNAVEYPDQTVQELSADRARVAVSTCIAGHTANNQTRLASAISRLVPADRLLSRDCQRYSDSMIDRERRRRTSSQSKRSTPPQRSKTRKLELVQEFQLKSGSTVDWLVMDDSLNDIFCAGLMDGSRLVLVQADKRGELQRELVWENCGQLQDYRGQCLLSVDTHGSLHALLHIAGGEPLQSKSFVGHGNQMTSATAGSLPGQPVNIITANRGEDGITVFSGWDDSPKFLFQVWADGKLTQTTYHDESAITCLLHWGHVVYVGTPFSLTCFDRRLSESRTILESGVKSISGSVARTRERIVTTDEEGCHIVWDGVKVQAFADHLSSPFACFGRGGHVFVADANHAIVYTTQKEQITHFAETPRYGKEVIGVFHGQKLDQFGMVSAEGLVSIFQIS